MKKSAALALPALTLTGCLLSCGCDRTPAAAPAPAPRPPLASGTDASVDLYDRSVDLTPNEVRHIKDGRRVVVYDDYLLVTSSEGRTFFAAKGHYADLSFKADAR